MLVTPCTYRSISVDVAVHLKGEDNILLSSLIAEIWLQGRELVVKTTKIRFTL